jgi:CRISPR-associated Cas5-like protein
MSGDPPGAAVTAVRAELVAPVASFRDPMFPGVTRCLPVPPLSTLRGMLAAATGNPAEPVTLGVSSHAEGGGIDTETYHPVNADGSNPAIAGRVRAIKGGTTIRHRPFLVFVHVTLWLPAPDGPRMAAALFRPVWGLHLGRSQDAVYLRSLREVVLHPAQEAVVGHALAPVGGHADPSALTIRLSRSAGPDRLAADFGDFLWCAEPAGRQRVAGAYSDGDQAVWLHAPRQ